MHGAPWGTMNDWLRLEVEERADSLHRVRGPRRYGRRIVEPTITRGSDPQPVATLSRDEVAVCA